MSLLLALGPEHPMWPGPQQLTLRVAGETIIEVEYQGVEDDGELERRLNRCDVDQALDIIARQIRYHPFAYGFAFCLAAEQAATVVAPPRAAVLRCIVAELERLISHVDATTMLFAIIGLDRRSIELQEIRRHAATVLQTISGTRSTDLLVPGGLSRDISAEQCRQALTDLQSAKRLLYRFVDAAIENRALLRRLVDVGKLSRSAAEQFGLGGPLARASGIPHDLRIDQQYAAYDQLRLQPVVQEAGDVYARVMVLLLEAFESTKLVEQALGMVPDGQVAVVLATPLPRGQAIAQVEAPAGALSCTVEVTGVRTVTARFELVRQMDRLLARTLLDRALVDNGLLIAASAAPYPQP